MTRMAVVERDQLKGIFDVDSLADTRFKVTISPITDEEADELEFKSLKGIAGVPLNIDNIRKERLKL